jgi:hypothetical protein
MVDETRNELLEKILAAILAGGSADNIRGGILDYNDSLTAVTPISVPSGLVDIDITNDGLGSFTNKSYAPVGVTDIWNSSTNLFDFSQLSLGDMIDIRVDLTVTTTSPNQLVEIDLALGIGGAQYSIPFSRNVYKNASAQNVNRYNGIYMGDLNTLNNPAKFVVRSDAPAIVLVNGWYCKVLKRG